MNCVIFESKVGITKYLLGRDVRCDRFEISICAFIQDKVNSHNNLCTLGTPFQDSALRATPVPAILLPPC